MQERGDGKVTPRPYQTRPTALRGNAASLPKGPHAKRVQSMWSDRREIKRSFVTCRFLQDGRHSGNKLHQRDPPIAAEGRACGWQAGDASEPSAILFVKGCSGRNPVLPDFSSMGERM
jgi:hypothetical protein